MVLTRAQRAQAKGTPPESPMKASVLKAPARRGRAKKTEEEATTKPAAKAAPSKATATLKSSVSKSSTSARLATTKSSAAKTIAPKTTITAKAPAAKASILKASSLKTSTSRKPATAKKDAKTTRASKTIVPQVEEHAQTNVTQEPIDVHDFAQASGEHITQTVLSMPSQFIDTIMGESQESQDQDPMTASTLPSPSKLPRPAPPPSQPTSPFKMSLLSPSKLFGSIRKPAVTTKLLATPVKPPLASTSAEPMDPRSLKRPAPAEEPTGLSRSPVRPISNSTSEEPLFGQSNLRDEPVGISRSPIRPLSTFQEPVSCQSPSIDELVGTSRSPIRPNTRSEEPIFARSPSRSVMAPLFSQSTSKRPAAPNFDSILVSPKRLRTSLSMPSLSMGSPKRSSSNQSGSPTSPVKSSMRSPEKRIAASPKKVSWHQSPRPQPVLQEEPIEREPGVLDGFVFFLDVNSVDGVNSNQLFVPVVEQLGGEWVPEWTSNSMGVTHVIFMNGEMRTLEKVVATNSQVHCVNISWLLDCERENLHLDEKEFKYAIDLTRIPGLLTPKPIKSYNYSNTPIPSRTPAAPPPQYAPTTPVPAREPLGLSSGIVIKTPAYLASKTPASVGMGSVPEDDKENVSPVSENTPLMQKTCPPKQLNKSIFLLDEAATPFKQRLLLARRKSAEWAPKIGSPLRRGGEMGI